MRRRWTHKDEKGEEGAFEHKSSPISSLPHLTPAQLASTEIGKTPLHTQGTVLGTTGETKTRQQLLPCDCNLLKQDVTKTQTRIQHHRQKPSGTQCLERSEGRALREVPPLHRLVEGSWSEVLRKGSDPLEVMPQGIQTQVKSLCSSHRFVPRRQVKPRWGRRKDHERLPEEEVLEHDFGRHSRQGPKPLALTGKTIGRQVERELGLCLGE